MMTLAALILAGGQSSRMGQDKALIPVHGVPMLRRVCEVALTCTPDVAIVTPWPDRYQAVVPAPCRFIQEKRLAKDSESQGPLVGFAQGLEQVQADWILLLACDLPRLDAAVLQHWMAQLNGVSESAIALLSKQPEGWEPLCGFYRTHCLSSLKAYLATGERSFQHWLDQQPVQELLPLDRAMLFNCNTPEDLRQLEARE